MYNNYYENENELKHYGVLGMKWGVHRSRVNAKKASKARAKGKIEKADKFQAKSDRIKAKHTKRVGGKASYDYTANQSVGRSVIKSMVFGTYGTLKYNELRSKNAGRGISTVNGLLYRVGNQVTSGLLSIAEPRLRN